MNNCRNHLSVLVLDAIHKHRHSPLFMSPYSFSMGTIEENWSKIKKYIKRDALNGNDTLILRIGISFRANDGII